MKLQELGLVSSRKIVSVPAESNVFAAMQLMVDESVSSVPLVDRGNRLVGSLSISDVHLDILFL